LDGTNDYLSPRRGQIVKQLRKQLSEYYKNKGYPVLKKYPFILSDWNNWDKNIIRRDVADYIKEIREGRKENSKPFPLHKYIHHGLSSQAMLFNLLGPLVVDQNYTVFDEILKKAGIATKGIVSNVEFEIEDRDIFKEKNAQPTSVDLVITTDKDEKYYCEFKFTEAEFGGCSLYFNGDCDGRNPSNEFNMCVLHAEQGREYWNLISKYNLLTTESRCPFIDMYQAYRVVMFALENNGEFILIHDERNPTFFVETPKLTRGVYARFLESLPAQVRDKCHLISTQQIFKTIQSSIKEPWVDELKIKYF